MVFSSVFPQMSPESTLVWKCFPTWVAFDFLFIRITLHLDFVFISLAKMKGLGKYFLRNVKSKKKQVKVSCQIQRVTKCWYALIITIIIIIFITTHYYIKQQFLVLGRGFSQWYDSLYFFLIQSFSPILPWYWRCFKYEIFILLAPKTHFILFGSFLWLEIQPHDDKNSILNDVQWLWLFWNPPNIKTHGYYTC